MAKRTYEDWKITTGFLNGNLFDGMEVEGVDEEASAARYAELLEADIRADYPGAEVKVRRQDGVGSEPYPHETRVFDPGDDEMGRSRVEEQHVDNIAGHLWENFDRWIIEQN